MILLLNSPSHDVVYHTMSLKKRCKITAYFRLDKKKAQFFYHCAFFIGWNQKSISILISFGLSGL